jgi:SAM-dependent methyltransferase
MLEITSERFFPSQTGQIKYEHWHRYALCLSAVAGKTVLDIASGEGYGSALLAQTARAVTGVDIAQEAVAHASARYAGRSNLRYLHGSCAAIPLPDQAVEVVTSFETIEHHEQHEEMMREIKRVLRPGGLLIISSPNKLVHTDLLKYQNPYHPKELYYEEFAALLGRHFQHRRFFGQRLSIGSFIYNLNASECQTPRPFMGQEEAVIERFHPLSNPLYFLALCSDAPEQVALALDSFYLEPDDDLWNQQWQEREQHANEAALRRQVAEQQQLIDHLSKDLAAITGSRAWGIVQALWKLRGRLRF